jgi:hypothetical protein
VIPWIILSVGPYIVLTPIKGVPYLLGHVGNILIGKENWYMPACIVAEIIWYYILKTRKDWVCGAISVFSFIAGIALYQRGMLNFLMINRAFCALIYIFMGHMFKQHEGTVKEHKMSTIMILCVIIYVALGIATIYFYPNQNLDVHLNRYYNYLSYLLFDDINRSICYCNARKENWTFPEVDHNGGTKYTCDISFS